MMNLKVIGTGCEDCDRLYENTKQAIAQLGIEAELEKVEDLMEIVKLGVMTAPSLMKDAPDSLPARPKTPGSGQSGRG